MPYKLSKQHSPALVLFAAGILLIIGILLSYLLVTGLVAIVLWSFQLDYSPWAAGLGVWSILILINLTLRK